MDIEDRGVPRVARVPDGGEGRVLLELGGRCFDLEQWLTAEGAPRSMRARIERGWLTAERLRAVAEDGHAPEIAPLEVGGGMPLLPPLLPTEVGQVLALGKNFKAHAAEFGEEVPEEPLVFAKLPFTITGSGEEVVVPAWYTGRYDHEAELALILGRGGSDVPEERALELVAGYTVANDLTARSQQGRDRKLGHPWLRAKNLGRALPLGPCFVPRDALDATRLTVRALVNGELRQEASTADLVVGIERALAYLSRWFVLSPGDVVLMGTPEGVSALHDGDEVACEITGIGRLVNRIRRPDA